MNLMCARDDPRRAVIVAAGGPPPESPQHQYIQDVLRDGDLLVAADGGTEVLRHLGLTPDAVVGDLDSLPQDGIARMQARYPGHIIRHPAEKDHTDGQLAVQWTLQQLECREEKHLIICGAFGDRFDHSLALALYAAALGRDSGTSIVLTDGRQWAYPVCGALTLRGAPGDTVSLIPLTGRATDVHIRGFRYPLSGGTLHWGQTLGVSNEMKDSRARVQVRGEGVLLAVHHTSDH